MATSTRQFNIDLYLEHLEDASMLYQQRLAYLHDPEVNWPDLATWEDRFYAHIDALVVGQERALDVCRGRLAEGDAGEKHAALIVLCRQQRKNETFTFLETLDSGDADLARAVSRALRSEAPSSWRNDLMMLFERDQAHLTSVLAEVIGYRRLPGEEQLLSKLAGKPQFGTTAIAWALGRVGTQRSISALSALLDGDDEQRLGAAAIALLRLGDDRVLFRAMHEARRQRWARRVLGIGGGPAAVHLLLDILAAEEPDKDTVLALGLLGDLAAVMPLVQLLDHDAVGAAAAVALNTITGAGLYGRTFVPDSFDPDELSDEERAAFEQDGTVPTRHGEPFGNFEQGPLRDPVTWRGWLEANKQSFQREYRWRQGQPYGPSALLECLRTPTSPYAIRAATYEELVGRYGLDEPFEIELRVEQQSHFLDRIKHWSLRNNDFTSGAWYLAGRLQTR